MIDINQKIKIENTLTELVSRLKCLDIGLTKTSSDGRVNSAVDEDLIVRKVIDIYNLEFLNSYECTGIGVPPVRAWCDFTLDYKNELKIPVNVKISKGNKADNLNCKLGLYHALTAKVPNFKNNIGWKKFFQLLKKDLNLKNNVDYYFLVIIKSDIKKSFWTSLKRLKHLVSNGNNLPFQCTWLNNTDISEVSTDDSFKYLMKVLNESAKKRAEFLNNLNEFFPEEKQ